AIGNDGHSITLSKPATANSPAGGTSLTFIDPRALDGNSMRFVSNTFVLGSMFTFHYSDAQLGYNILDTMPTDVCVVLYHATGTATPGGHSVFGDGPGLNTDNSYSNNTSAANPNGSFNEQTSCAGSDLSITKVDNRGGSSITGAVGSVLPGQQIVY